MYGRCSASLSACSAGSGAWDKDLAGRHQLSPTQPGRTTPAAAASAGRYAAGWGDHMHVQLLGRFGVEVAGRTVDPSRWRLTKARTVVKLLALDPAQRLHREYLLDLLWPDLSPSAAANNLHQALHAARRALAGEGADGLLELRDQVVVLRAGGLVEVDAARFRTQAEAALDSGDLAGLRAAHAAYRGELLPDDRYETWVRGPRDELHALHRNVLVMLGDRARAEGSLAEAEAALELALQGDPLHEPALRSLMRALAAAGRRSAALQRYERARDDLRSAYGTDPDPESRQLYRELLVGSADVAATKPGDALAEGGGNLPPAVTSFVGRDREVAQVRRLLRRSQLVTLTGPGGAGKTRLAQEAARLEAAAMPDGAWFVDLVPVRHRRLVADTVAVAMGLPPAAGGDPLRALTVQLARRRLLLILDNCEHLLPECARVATTLRARCPGVSVLATSREPLHVDGEVVLRVPSLGLPEPGAESDPETLAGLASVRLFLERVRDLSPDFALDRSNAGAVVEICRRLDGIPLALELAAARTVYLQPAEIAERLGDALSVLGRPGTATRHATLRAALEWSHGLLTAEEQCLLRRLAVFEGGCTVAAAEQVCAGGPVPAGEVLDVLGRLVDKSLVQVDGGTGRSRYRLLDTVRQLAAERLQVAGETGALQDAHTAYFCRLAAEHDLDGSATMRGGRPQQLELERGNLRAALAHSLEAAPDDALALAVSLWPFWMARGHYVEGVDWLQRALAAASDTGQRRAAALRGLAVLEIRLGHLDRATGLATQAVGLPQLIAAPEPERILGRLFVGFLSWLAGDLDAAAASARESAAAGTRLRRVELEAAALWLAGLTALSREDIVGAEDTLATCLDRLAPVDPLVPPFFPGASICISPMTVGTGWAPAFEETALLGQRVGARHAIGYVQSALGSAHRLALRPAAALVPVQAAVETFRSLGDPAGLALALNHLACVERDLASPDALDHLAEALRLREEIGDRRGATLTLASRGLAEAAAGDSDRGRASVRAALARVEAIEDRPGEAGILLDLAVVELVAGETRAARALAEGAVDLFRPQGYRRMDALVLTFAGQLAAEQGDHRAARRHAERAQRLFSRMGHRPGQQRAAAVLSTAAKDC
jgi:predicted ATPase/DNA-binding SARP family transcriptional activator